MVQLRVGQGCGVGVSIGHGQEVGAVCLLKLEWDLDDFAQQACLPAMQSSVLKCCLLPHFCRNTAVSEAHPHQKGGLQQDLLLLTVTKDGRTTTGQQHPATFPGNVYSWKIQCVE